MDYGESIVLSVGVSTDRDSGAARFEKELAESASLWEEYLSRLRKNVALAKSIKGMYTGYNKFSPPQAAGY